MVTTPIIDSILEVLLDTVEGIALDGMTGFFPVVTIARLLLGRGLLKDVGRGEPTRQQLVSIRSAVRQRPDLFEIRKKGRTTYVRVMHRGKTITLEM